jgi:hypothetical protein
MNSFLEYKVNSIFMNINQVKSWYSMSTLDKNQTRESDHCVVLKRGKTRLTQGSAHGNTTREVV